MKKIFNFAICVCLLLCITVSNVYALSIGPYTGAATTYYINPDTGVTDDGGSQNVAVGEGMCRSVIGETALVEYDGSKTYVTLRVMLLSNIRNLKFAVQQTKGDNNSYREVNPDIMAEDAENDCADYRFAVPQSDSYVKCTAYIIPMSRDVTFYLNVSTDLHEGGGDFVVSVAKQAQTQSSGSSNTVARSSDSGSNHRSDSNNNFVMHQTVEEYYEMAVMYEALNKVSMYEFIMENGGLDMQIKQNASNLSGGQKQRLALARALLKNSDIYIFDEVTSNIDAESERIILDVIYEMAKSHTVIIISHKLTNIAKANTVYFMEDGVIAESGMHKELMLSGGEYSKIYTYQQALEKYAGGGANEEN